MLFPRPRRSESIPAHNVSFSKQTMTHADTPPEVRHQKSKKRSSRLEKDFDPQFLPVTPSKLAKAPSTRQLVAAPVQDDASCRNPESGPLILRICGADRIGTKEMLGDGRHSHYVHSISRAVGYTSLPPVM